MTCGGEFPIGFLKELEYGETGVPLDVNPGGQEFEQKTSRAETSQSQNFFSAYMTKYRKAKQASVIRATSSSMLGQAGGGYGPQGPPAAPLSSYGYQPTPATMEGCPNAAEFVEEHLEPGTELTLTIALIPNTPRVGEDPSAGPGEDSAVVAKVKVKVPEPADLERWALAEEFVDFSKRQEHNNNLMTLKGDLESVVRMLMFSELPKFNLLLSQLRTVLLMDIEIGSDMQSKALATVTSLFFACITFFINYVFAPRYGKDVEGLMDFAMSSFGNFTNHFTS